MEKIKVKVLGSGTVTQHSVGGGRYIQLKAIPDYGAKFIRWEKFDQLHAGSPTFSSTNLCNVNTRYTSDVVAVFSNSEFIDNKNGTISDPNTGLMWAAFRDSRAKNLHEALVLTSDLAEFSDWRLPTSNELRTISPIDERFFTQPTRGYYFSSSKKQSQGSSLYDFYELVTSAGMSDIIHADSDKEAYVRFVRREDGFSINVSLAGTGDGVVEKKLSNGFKYENTEIEYYRTNSLIEINAIPKEGSEFKGWRGDIESNIAIQIIAMDAEKSIVAEFEKITYPLHLKIQGSGQGSVSTGTEENQYPHGSSVLLQAIPDKGSKFKQWVGEIGGTATQATIKMDGPKTVTAEFVRLYSLTVSTQGKGQIKSNDLANEYEAGSTVTLTAIPEEGHEFVQWHEVAFGANPVCGIVMNSNRAVQAEFRPLPVFDLKVMHAGTGSGVVLPNKQAFWQGSEVELIAQAAKGCVFDGWGGDLGEGLEETRKVTVNTHLAVTATFNRVEVPETEIALVFDGTTCGDAQNGNATVFLFTVSNRSDRQIHLDIPLAGFVTLRGEEIEQATWVKGMIDGEKGATLRARTFRKMGLVFDRRQLAKVELGEHLHVTMLQSKPAQQLSFTFRCTDVSKQVLTLVKAVIEPLAVAHENSPDSGGLAAQAELTVRMQLLEKSLQEALGRLNTPPTAAPQAADAPTQTLPEVLAWLCTQNSVPLAVLRQKLLPLGLMPSAVMDDVNERAFDVAGEPALDEAADTVIVQRQVLLQVLAVL